MFKKKVIDKELVDLIKKSEALESQEKPEVTIKKREMANSGSEKTQIVLDLVQKRIESGLPLKKWFTEVKK